MGEHWPHPTGDVSETAGWWVPGRDRTQRLPRRPPAGGSPPAPPRPPQPSAVPRRRAWGRALLSLLALALLLGLAGGVLAMAGYVYVAMQLPPPALLQERALSLSTSLVLTDRQGVVIGEIADPQSGRRQLVRLSEISPWLIQATVATEDPRFWQHPGFDPLAIARALWQNLREGDVVSGASTIPQQLVRNLLISPERTLRRKIKEVVLAAEITRRYPREQILEIYLNTIYYGNLAYGAEAAARTYFGKPAKDLTLAEASFLAGLPQAPALYDPFTPQGRERALRRHRDVLRLMVEAGVITPEQAEAAAREMAAHVFEKPATTSPAPEAPHFALYVLQWLEQTFGLQAQSLHRGGLRVETTLDLRLQRMATQVLRAHLEKLQDKNVNNGAVVILDPHTGEILAMVGSPDYNDAAHGGQINMAVVPRQPGSSIKPLTYLVAFEKGWTPATLIWDVPTRFPDGPGRFYEPVNYDRRFHGPVTVRYALGNSYNVPAVKALAFVGLPAFLQRARDLGITTLTRDDYGLSLTLGGGEVPLLEMAGLYAAFANEGRRVPPVPVRRITDAFGNVLYAYTPPPGQPVMRPEHAYLITSILSDNEARRAAFGPNSPLRLSRPAAAKTGTTNDFRDNWTLGYTPDLVVGVWVGNADNTPMKGVTGITGAAPVWHDVMEEAHRLLGLPPKEFRRPPGIIEAEICLDSGTMPSRPPARGGVRGGPAAARARARPLEGGGDRRGHRAALRRRLPRTAHRAGVLCGPGGGPLVGGAEPDPPAADRNLRRGHPSGDHPLAGRAHDGAGGGAGLGHRVDPRLRLLQRGMGDRRPGGDLMAVAERAAPGAGTGRPDHHLGRLPPADRMVCPAGDGLQPLRPGLRRGDPDLRGQRDRAHADAAADGHPEPDADALPASGAAPHADAARPDAAPAPHPAGPLAAHRDQEAATRAWRPSRMRSSMPVRTARTAMWMAFFTALASERPWPMMTTPFTPSNGAPPYSR